MNAGTRLQMVKAMEFIARQVNDEEVFELWLLEGPGDGEIQYGDTAVSCRDIDTDLYDYYCGGHLYQQDEADEHFRDLMDTFLDLMKYARRSGGLFCDEIVSNRG